MQSTLRPKMLWILIILCKFALYFASPDCMFGDSICWTKFYNTISPKIADGIPELGTERLDTMHLDLVEIRRNDLFYRSTNNTLSGLKGSIIDEISNYKDLKVMVLVFRANLTMKGDYTLNGSLFSIPITGNGEIKILLNKCRFEMIMPYEIIKDKNDKGRINLKSYVFSAHAYGGIQYSLENLLPGQSDMSEKIHVLLNKNWRVVEANNARTTFDLMMAKIFKAFRVIVASYEIKL